MNLIYMAKPVYGGWVSFTCHLSLKYDYPLFRISKRTEKKKRNLGYGVGYQNMNIEELSNKSNILITAIDKNYYQYLDKIPDGSYIVIHDPTEVKGKKNILLEHIQRFNIITIRETMYNFLLDKHNIKSKFIPHPFYEFPKGPLKEKNNVVSISRIDFDKNIDVLIRANLLIDNDASTIDGDDAIPNIDIFGAKNDIYVHHHLTNKLGLPLDKYYKGRFKKDFNELANILNCAKYVIDMSSIANDGSGSQYTFLEAIYCGCILILNKKWINPSVNSLFIDGKNCFIVENENDILSILSKYKGKDENLSVIIEESKKIIKKNLEADWSFKSLKAI